MDIKDINLDIEEPKYFFNEKPVPRVTSIISSILDKPYLIEWANKLGLKNKKYKTVLNKAAEYGTLTHEQIEQFLKTGAYPEEGLVTNSFHSFINWYNKVAEFNELMLVLSEQTLVNEYYGGTLDVIMPINGYEYIIDFKTSNNVDYGYFIQLAAYYKLLSDTGYDVSNIKGVIILQLNKFNNNFTEHILILDPNNQNNNIEFFNHCMETFDAMVKAYYMIENVKSEYNSLNQ